MNRYFHLVNPWWGEKSFKSGISRPEYIEQLEQALDQKIIQILTGLRRVGKSTIALQLIKKLINKKHVSPKNIFFFSIDEPSISNTPIIQIINEYRAEHDLTTKTKIYVFIDEIQFRKNWAQEIKSIYDSENVKFILTGSSAMLLSEKLSLLTGRYIKTQIFPLNFKEYLSFKNFSISNENDFLLQKKLEEYLQEGGMPEYILNKIDKYLETTVESILFKDLVSKFQLRNPSILTDLIYLLSDRIGTTSSSLKLSKILEVNKDTVLTYLNYLNKTFITSEFNNYSTSRNKEIYNAPKIYFEDTGIANKYSSKTNMGALAENVIYNSIKQSKSNKLRVKLGYWYENQSEIDFVIENNKIITLIESKWINKIDEINFRPIEVALKSINPQKIIYLTKNLKHNIKQDHVNIQLIPLREFLLSNQSNFIS